MASSYDKITRREVVNELFEQLGQVLDRKVQVLLIGGAVLLEQGLRDSTKDIDVVCRNENDKETLLFSARRGLDLDAVYEEIERQYRKAGELEQKIWITYIEEGIGRQEEEFSMKVPIAGQDFTAGE